MNDTTKTLKTPKINVNDGKNEKKEEKGEENIIPEKNWKKQKYLD